MCCLYFEVCNFFGTLDILYTLWTVKIYFSDVHQTCCIESDLFSLQISFSASPQHSSLLTWDIVHQKPGLAGLIISCKLQQPQWLHINWNSLSLSVAFSRCLFLLLSCLWGSTKVPVLKSQWWRSGWQAAISLHFCKGLVKLIDQCWERLTVNSVLFRIWCELGKQQQLQQQ